MSSPSLGITAVTVIPGKLYLLPVDNDGKSLNTTVAKIQCKNSMKLRFINSRLEREYTPYAGQPESRPQTSHFVDCIDPLRCVDCNSGSSYPYCFLAQTTLALCD